jgi:hypothetical protein
MLKKVLFSLFSGLVVFGFCHLISNHTHLLTGIERNLQRGFFFLREYDAGDENPLVSAEAKILGFDEDAIAAIGKWPWKRYVHGEFLRNVGEFSPRAVFFDIIFATRETVPSFVEKKLQAYPESSALVEQAFDDMDGYFSEALKEYDNVYLDLHLIEQPRP